MELKERNMKLLYHVVGTVLLFQIIYFYNPYSGWFHLPLFILNLVIIDLYQIELRKLKTEIITLILFFSLSLASIYMSKLNVNLSVIIDLNIFALLIMCSIVSLKSLSMIRKKPLETFINERNMRIIEKKTRFMPAFFIVVELCLVFSATKILFRIPL